MRSVTLALNWEMLQNDKWKLLAFALAANFFPVLLLSALARDGYVDPLDSSQILVHVFLVQINVFIFGAALMSMLTRSTRHHVLPITTANLVTSRLLPAMVLMAAEMALSTVMVNALFGLHWPIWGPALYAAVSLVVIAAVLWQTEKSTWLFLALTGVSIPLALWHRSRHGSILGPPTHYWDHLTLAEGLTMTVVGVVAFFAAIQGVARNRCGDTLHSLGILAWLNRLFDPPPAIGAPFPSPAAAQFWFIWRQKGWAMPACVIFGAVFGSLMWLITNRQATDLLEGVVAAGGVLTIVGLLGGFVIGNYSSNDASFEMGSFLGTRPVTTNELSKTLFKVLLYSVFSSWCIWAASLAAVSFIIWATGIAVHPTWAPGFSVWWYAPATILGPWIVAGLGASLGLTGRNALITGVICGGLALLIGGMISAGMVLSHEAQEQLMLSLCVTLGVAFVAGTALALIIARRRSLVASSTVYATALVWLLLSAPIVAVALMRIIPTLPVPVSILGVGVAALAVAPVSLIPLAVAWNRVR